MIADTDNAPTVSKRTEANRRNAKKSCGPKSSEGKARVRLNALKHGMTAETLVLDGESAEGLKARVAAWKDHLKPQTELEDYLAERAAHASWQLDRCDRSIAAKLNEMVRFGLTDRDEAESDEVEDLARRLFWDPRGPIALYPHFRGFRIKPRISCPDEVDDPLHPARIVNRLEATLAGCRWLLDRWADLRQLLEDGLNWQAPDRLRAIRLVGRQPMDALADERVLQIYLACDAMEPGSPTSLEDLKTETDAAELALFKQRVQDRGGDRKKPASPEAGRAALLGLIGQAASRLEAKLVAHRERREFEQAIQADLMAFDERPEGELARRYQLAKGRELHRILATYYKVQREALAAADCESPAVEASIDAEAAPGPDPVGWVQPTDPSPGDPVGCAEPSTAPPTPPEASPAPEAGDETKPNPPAPAAPVDPEPAAAMGGPSYIEEYLEARRARLDPSDPFRPMIDETLSDLRRPWGS
jgi:hypothetical protein